ncbi:MAG: segregation/condensation protein A [Clostridiales bacterium]|nr:segregation/condensation protein A [Clostridiales bacterium]MDD7035031.1 segregation/condensation protein A [Bacillota bacterium]MDY2920356.1 segregation/condensation protein A [Lentihominibacter sp.]
MTYRVRLNVFEGPFDLLVYLIERAEMSIYDIKISEITSQYMEYLEEMRSEDVALSAEFMVLAAELLQIKSRMLLPRTDAESTDAAVKEDPRTELVEKLREYKKYKAVSEMLEAAGEEARCCLEKPQEDLAEYTGDPDEYLSLDIEEFRKAFSAFLRRKKKLEEIRAHHRRSEKQRLTTEVRMGDIRDYFRGSRQEEADFRDLVKERESRYDISVTFSSVLEMMKSQELDAEQERIFGDITVKAQKGLYEKTENQVGD